MAEVGWERKLGTATNSLTIVALETKHLSLERIGWLYPIFRDVHFHHGLLAHCPLHVERAWSRGGASSAASSNRHRGHLVHLSTATTEMMCGKAEHSALVAIDDYVQVGHKSARCWVMAARPTQSKRPSGGGADAHRTLRPSAGEGRPSSTGKGQKPRDFRGVFARDQASVEPSVVDQSESKDNEKTGSWLHGRTSYSTSSSVKERPRW